MIVSRIALFFAMVVAIATTQLPEYMQQYRQRLGGAIDELAAVVAQFDNEAKAEGLSETDGIARLEANSDRLAKARGVDMANNVARLAKLQRSAAALDNPNRFVRWQTFATTFDTRVAARAYEAFQPAVPTTADGFVAGLIGFVIGGGLVHVFALPIRYRHKLFRGRAGASSTHHAGAFGNSKDSALGGTRNSASALREEIERRRNLY
jgi:hypothetical protein